MYKKPLDLYERLGSSRISAARRRAAIADLQQSEAIVDLIFRAANVLRSAAARIARVFGGRRKPPYKERHYGRRVQNALRLLQHPQLPAG